MRLTMVTALAVALLAAPAAWAQTDDEVNAAVQFNFSTPGARSLAMGGAFLGSVDDATAAYANPAGLLQLTEPEVLVEGRRWRYSTQFADRGRASGVPTGFGVDTVAGVELGTAESELSGISYAAFVYPRPRWAWAAFYHQTAKFQTAFETGGIFAESQSGPGDVRLLPIQTFYDLDVSQAGLAVAGRWGGWAVGLAVSDVSLRLDSFTQRYDLPTSSYGPADFRRGTPANFQTQQADSDEVGFVLGLRWDRSEKVSLGLVYRYGPEFDLAVLSSSDSPGVPVPPRVIFTDKPDAVFNLPDVAGLGLTFRPSQAWTVTFDVDWVGYSQLNEKFFVIFEEVDGLPVQAEDFVLDDATEVHLGFEYVWTHLRTPIALRFGGWYDPDHRLRTETGPALNAVRFFPGDDEIHYSAGLGWVLGSHFQVDAAADFSDIVDTASVSAAVRF
jgi:long-chain fatty acid transport protein